LGVCIWKLFLVPEHILFLCLSRSLSHPPGAVEPPCCMVLLPWCSTQEHGAWHPWTEPSETQTK
jgi:hypothetical protein